MRQSFDADRIPGYRAEERMEAVLRFRRLWSRYERPDDVNQLLKQFEHRLTRGHGGQLIFVREGEQLVLTLR